MSSMIQLPSSGYNINLIPSMTIQPFKYIELLSTIAESQPQLAYAAFTKGLAHRWLYYMRTLEDISEELKPLEDVITNKLLPAITGNSTLTRHERQILSLPCRLGGLRIEDPTAIADQHYT